ncbi:TolC family outer membrane protein [Pseudomonas kunmingensis]|uniref:TolC family outer membrane protein n=1 Tax=Stutzerimonas kunmingensis TaxID=1211807 RepID=UPI00174699D5|nr:TolC family outer membrane protein [Stutzerimonas kunmingensis]MBD3876332.1 TolC family outer membrane protein [Stutzerimonas kunmingensis]
MAASLRAEPERDAIPVPTSVSASSYATDLMSLYREARLEDPRVLAAYARAVGGQARQREALGGLLPQLNASGSLNRTKYDNRTTEQVYNNERYLVSLTQHLYNKAAWENYQKFKSLARQGEFQAVDAQAEATVDLAQRYFVALASDDELELVMAERRATQKNLDRVNAMYERKLAMITDVLDLRARVDALAAQEVEARNQVRLSREDLSELVGRTVAEKLSRIREDVALQVPGESLDVWIDRAVAANPALKARESALAAAEAAVREGKGGHYPQLSLNLTAQRSDVGYDNTLAPLSDSYVASVGVQIPLYSGGSTSARVRALYNDRLATEQELEAIRRQVVKETTSAYLTAQSSVERIRASRNALESAEKSSVAAEKGFQYGVVNSVDVLTSVQNEYTARRDLLKAQYDFIINLLVLNRWAGRLSEQSVENVNVWLARSEEARALERKTTE